MSTTESGKKEFLEIDLNKIFNIYSETNKKLSNIEDTQFEQFRSSELDYKEYQSALGLLEKAKDKADIHTYELLFNNILDGLKDSFDPNDVKGSCPAIYGAIEEINGVASELDKISKLFKGVKNTWTGFKKRSKIPTESKLIKNVDDTLIQLSKDFLVVDISGLTRIEENIVQLKNLISRIIVIIEKINNNLSDNEFIGAKPIALKTRMEAFLNSEDSDADLKKFINDSSEIEEDLEKYKSQAVLKRIRMKVIKIINPEDKKIYNYGAMYNDVLLNLSESINPVGAVLEDTGEVIYIDDFPVFGIIPLSVIGRKLQISKNQFKAISELSNISLNLFILSIVGSLTIISSSLFGGVSPFLTIPMVGGVLAAFSVAFKGLKYRINSRLDVNNMFYFVKIDYVFRKEGENVNISNLTIKILENFEKLKLTESTLEKE